MSATLVRESVEVVDLKPIRRKSKESFDSFGLSNRRRRYMEQLRDWRMLCTCSAILTVSATPLCSSAGLTRDQGSL